jgi:hypothetical protein
VSFSGVNDNGERNLVYCQFLLNNFTCLKISVHRTGETIFPPVQNHSVKHNRSTIHLVYIICLFIIKDARGTCMCMFIIYSLLSCKQVQAKT